MIEEERCKVVVRECLLQKDEVITELSKVVHLIIQEQIKRITRRIKPENYPFITAWKNVANLTYDECSEWRKAFYARKARQITDVLDRLAKEHRENIRKLSNDVMLDEELLPRLDLGIPMPPVKRPRDFPEVTSFIEGAEIGPEGEQKFITTIEEARLAFGGEDEKEESCSEEQD